MNFALIGLDYKTADLALREQVSFSDTAISHVLEQIKNEFSQVNGAVLVSTCNRTELYLSLEKPLSKKSAMDIFSYGVSLPKEWLEGHIYIYEQEETIRHLFELACGLKSMILGEDQIITQLKHAAALAAQSGAADGPLNTLFRHGITCGKRAKSTVLLKNVAPSMASKGIEVIEAYLRHNSGATALVIGNGEVGRNACEILVSRGCKVYMTLRSYKKKETIVPAGCIPVPYEERAQYLEQADVVVSATKSPHHTITYEMLSQCRVLPKYIIDLAVPRDIDARVAEFSAIQYYDVDTIGKTASQENLQELEKIRQIITEQRTKFEDWAQSKRDREGDGGSHFPIFLNLQDRKIVIIGAGKIAARRVKTLLRYGGQITVVAPVVCDEILRLKDKVELIQEPYSVEHLEDAFLVITATNDAAVNDTVCKDCKGLGLLVNTAHDKGQCDFYFPAMFAGNGVVGGLISTHGDNHKKAKETAQNIRDYLAKEGENAKN